MASLSVFVDAACLGNGTLSAKGGYRIYIAPDDPRNVCVAELPGRQSNNRAHLHSMIAVLNICHTMSLKEIHCIQTCSKIVVCTSLHALVVDIQIVSRSLHANAICLPFYFDVIAL